MMNGRRKLGRMGLWTTLLAGLLVVIASALSPALAADLGLIEPITLKWEAARWVVLDARPKAQWAAGHLPGARSLSWESYTRTDEKGIPYQPLPVPELARALAAMGIDEKTPVVVYGDADTSWGGEGWTTWLLAWLGHKGPIRLLDGGIQGWRAEDLPINQGVEPVKTVARYQVELQPQLDISTAEIESKRESLVLIDTRSTMEWLKGRIPGAIHIPWDEFYQGDPRVPLSAAALKKILAENKVDTGKPIVYYCAGGIRSAYAWLVHELAGLPHARNYEGSMEAWKRRPGA